MPESVVRSPQMDAIIAKVRQLIGDPAAGAQQFDDAAIQDALDSYRSDVRYEMLTPAPAIVNTAGNDNGAANFIWADYYSLYHWWEGDVVIQDGHFLVLTPAASDLLVGHWQFELNVFTSGVVPGEYPPVFATGKTYDVYAASAELLDMWAASSTRAYDFTADGRTFRRSQMAVALMKMADLYRRKARPHALATIRTDLTRVSHAEQVPILGSNRDFIAGE